jgi:hypothetical protein
VIDLFEIGVLETVVFLRIVLGIGECLCVVKKKERNSISRERAEVCIVFRLGSLESYMLPPEACVVIETCLRVSIVVLSLCCKKEQRLDR